MNIKVVYAEAHDQKIVSLKVPLGTTALEAVKCAYLADEFPELQGVDFKLGIFSKPVSHEYRVQEGDRVEIYRPLKIDPKEKRLMRAKAKPLKGNKR
ncbi:MAG: RnfH family protein [Gammaproteobacteria bacterium]|nr:RnfH family protein [Gammaproteobacteria bacterium]